MQCKSKNVPSDGNCLYWSVVLAYLLPVKDDRTEFETRLRNLFGTFNEEEESSILASIQKYNPLSKEANLSENMTRSKGYETLFD